MSNYLLGCGTVGSAREGFHEGQKITVELFDENGKIIFVEGVIKEVL
jgi:hypothetical protein